MSHTSPFLHFQIEKLCGAPSAQGPWQSPPARGKRPAWWLSGHLLEAEVSFHFEMPLQVPRKEKSSCCCHHQLFPQIVQPLQLPLRTLLMKAGSWGPTWRQAGEVKEKVSPQSAGPGVRPLPLLAAPQSLGFKSAQICTGFIPSVMCIYYPSYMYTHTGGWRDRAWRVGVLRTRCASSREQSCWPGRSDSVEWKPWSGW